MDAHRPARADLGLPSPGVAGDADAGDAGVPDASLSLHPHPILGNHAGGEMVYPRPVWLALFGPRRNEWPLRAVVEAYLQRSHQEHGHRFLKRHLLATAYQTPQTENEERWWRIVVLAHFALWLARRAGPPELRPWERYLPRWREKVEAGRVLPPAQVQRG